MINVCLLLNMLLEIRTVEPECDILHSDEQMDRVYITPDQRYQINGLM